MAKLRGAKKEEFLRRMARGRKKAAAKNPKRKKSTTAKKAQPKKKKNGKLTGAKKAEFLKRMARGRRKAGGHQNPKRKAKRATKKRRRNPDELDQAEQKFQEFHGKPASRILEYDEMHSYRENFAEMGKLIELRFNLNAANMDFPLTHFADCQAVCTPDGANIYFIGGDQRVDFEALEIASDKDMVELGSCTYISYRTVKGFHDFEPTSYWHRFGEEDGILPLLTYDRLNRNLFLIGGNYRVRPEGIVN
jgi:hypothetical protein